MIAGRLLGRQRGARNRTDSDLKSLYYRGVRRAGRSRSAADSRKTAVREAGMRSCAVLTAAAALLEAPRGGRIIVFPNSRVATSPRVPTSSEKGTTMKANLYVERH